jgi:uncharacterized protein (TIGR02594 family)
MAGIPAKYAFLSTVGAHPPTILHALDLLGTDEEPGRASNDVIDGWRDEINAAHPKAIQGFSDDSVPWCGLFAAIVTHRAGHGPILNPLWARNWAKFGEPVADNTGTDRNPRLRFVDDREASLGDILVYVRDGGGHVGFYIAEDGAHYHTLGGNQSDSVTITRVAKARCIAIRRAPMTEPPESVRPYYVTASGAVSTNEA